MTALDIARAPMTGSAPFAALLSRITAADLVARIEAARRTFELLGLRSRSTRRDLTPDEEREWDAAEAAYTAARDDLRRLVSERIGVGADALLEALS